MTRKPLLRAIPLALSLVVAGCATTVSTTTPKSTPTPTPIVAPTAEVMQRSEHRGDDDLLSAGLGLAGLQAMTPPAIADAASPTAAELRRRAMWANWRGIAWLSPQGIGALHDNFPHVEGREVHALLRLHGHTAPHRVMLQVPDGYPGKWPCLVVTASSGSRGIYGAISLAGGWGLPRGCAVVYTDKGAGTDWIVPPAKFGPGIDGRPVERAADSAFALRHPPVSVAVKHVHSGDNPEAHWGEHVRQAAQWALAELRDMHPKAKPPKLLVTGLSNGGGAVLQAAGLSGWSPDAVVAVAPNVYAGKGGRPLYDVGTDVALFLPCALTDPGFADAPLRPDPAAGQARCDSLVKAGALTVADGQTPAAAALARLKADGWTDGALRVAATSQRFDLFRAVLAGYASAYTRRTAEDMACGYRYTVADPAVAALAWSDSSGIPPGSGIALEDGGTDGDDPALAGLQCLRALWQGEDRLSGMLHEGIEATRAKLPPASLPIWVLHGEDDGLVPIMFSSEPYVAWLRANGRNPDYRPIPKAQHFDAFLPLPGMQDYVPLLPAAWQALDDAWQRVGAK